MRRKARVCLLDTTRHPKFGDHIVEPQVVPMLPERDYWVWCEVVEQLATGEATVLAFELHPYNQAGLGESLSHYFGAHCHVFDDDAKWRSVIPVEPDALYIQRVFTNPGIRYSELHPESERVLMDAFVGVSVTLGLLRSDGDIIVLAGSTWSPEQQAANRCDLPQSCQNQDFNVVDCGVVELPFAARGFHRVNAISTSCANGGGYADDHRTFLQTFLPVIEVVGHMSIRSVECNGHYEWVLNTVGFDLWPIDRVYLEEGAEKPLGNPIENPDQMFDLIQTSLPWVPFSQSSTTSVSNVP